MNISIIRILKEAIMKKIKLLLFTFILFSNVLLFTTPADAVVKYKWGNVTMVEGMSKKYGDSFGKIKVKKSTYSYSYKKGKWIKNKTKLKKGAEYPFAMDKNSENAKYYLIQKNIYIKYADKNITYTWLSDPIRYKYIGKGTIQGNVTYQYNQYIGTKPDINASVMAIPIGDSLISPSHIKDNFMNPQPLNSSSTLYPTKVDGFGHYELKLPEGNYILIYKSNKITREYESPLDEYTFNLLKDRIIGLRESSLGLFWYYQYKVLNNVEIIKNENITYSIDWGYTYF